MDTYLSPKMLLALEFAARAHYGQKRRGFAETPYISHPYAVGLILLQAGFPEDVVIAGIFHDVIEDTTFSRDDIVKGFGERIALLVEEVTEDATLSRQDQKRSYLEHLVTASVEAKAISAADLYANRMSMLTELLAGDNTWIKRIGGNVENVFAYDRKRIGVIKTDLQHELVTQLEELVNRLERLCLSDTANYLLPTVN